GGQGVRLNPQQLSTLRIRPAALSSCCAWALVRCLPLWAFTSLRNACSVLHACDVLPALNAWFVACSFATRLLPVPLSRAPLLTQPLISAIRALSWPGAPVTVTVKLELARLPLPSAAVQVTVVVPTANVLPDAGEQITGTEAPVLSVAAGAGQVTTAPLGPV